jgi:hypothetical protein
MSKVISVGATANEVNMASMTLSRFFALLDGRALLGVARIEQAPKWAHQGSV